MASQENQVQPLNTNQVESDISTKPLLKEKQDPEVSSIKQDPVSASKSLEVDNGLDDSDDVDLSAVQIATSLLNQTLALDDLAPDLDMPDGNDEAYKNIMGLCSSTTENIKKSIYDILNSREKVEITEEDTASIIQESLNKKMEDFKKVISGCFDNDTTQTAQPTLENTEGVAATESLDSEKILVDDSDKGQNSTVSSEEQSKCSVSTSKNKTDVLDNKDKPKNIAAGNLNSNPSTVKAGVPAAKIDAKASNNNEKKSNTSLDDCPSNSSKQLPTTAPLIRDVLRSSISPDEERVMKRQRNSAAKRKGEKTVDQILKSLGTGSTEDKLQTLCKKHLDALEEFRLIEPRLKQLERQFLNQQREKETLQGELNRMILAKSRLEGLCREMQRQSKLVKEESLIRIKEEEEKRKEVANKFQATLNDISSLMQENSKKNIQLREENAELATKLKGLVDNYEIWEQNMSKVVQQKELETQLAKAKHAKVNLLLKQETEKFLREKQSLLENLSELQKRCTVLTSNELQLRTELSDYTSKYEEFQSVLSNSSKVFSTFKNDMETTSKKIKKLEKETNVYKQKWESSNKALVDMIQHKDQQDKEFSNAQQRILTLEKLCRALQAERNELRNQVNTFSSSSVPTNNADVPSLTTEAGAV